MITQEIFRQYSGFVRARNQAPGFEDFIIFNSMYGRRFFDPQNRAKFFRDEDRQQLFVSHAYPKIFDVTGPDYGQNVAVPREVAGQLDISPVTRLAIRREISFCREENSRHDMLAFHVAISALRRLRSPRPLAEFLQIAPADSYRELFGGAVRVVLHDKDGGTFVPIGLDHNSTILFLRDFGIGKATPAEGLRTRLLGSRFYQAIKRQGTW